MLARGIGVSLVFAWTLASFLPAAHADDAALVGLDVREDGARGSEDIVLTFASRVPDLDVEIQEAGVKVSLPGTTVEDSVAQQVRLDRTPSGIELLFARSAASVDAFRISGSTVTIRLTHVSGDDGHDGYRMGPGDIVTVSVYRDADLSGDYPVLQDGTILMPLIGAVPAAGTTESDLAARIADKLSGFLVEPQVRAGVKEYQSQFVLVTGDVDTARRISLEPGMTLKAVLSEAGKALRAGQDVEVASTDGKVVILESGDLDKPDAPLPRNGDVLTVQEPDRVFVSGEVRKPGPYEYKPGMTLQQLLILAEGLTEWATRKDISIQPQGGGQKKVVNLKKVEEREAPDPVLEPGDIVVVRRRIL
jgi:polysaccharide export outer membrane protein